MTRSFLKLPYLLITIVFGISALHANAQPLQCPDNIGFENGNLNNWTFATGRCCPVFMGTPSAPVPGRHDLISTAGTDPYGGFPTIAPGGGNFSLKLGNSNVGAQAESATYYVRVPSTANNIFTIVYKYAVVFEDPRHDSTNQPSFMVNVFDSATGNPVPCNQFRFVASSSLPGFKKSTIGRDVYYKDWSSSSIDLSGLGGRTVAIQFTNSDCGLGGHFGYSYIDVSCGLFQSTKIFCNGVSNITLTAPPGFQLYEWFDSSTQTIIGNGEKLTIPTPPVAKTFGVILHPYVGFGCPDTVYTQFSREKMSLNPSSDTSICKGESTQLDVTANSTATPYTYSWLPTTGLSCVNCQSPVATPQSNTMYYVTITDTNGCFVTDSVFVEVHDVANASFTTPGDTFCMFEEVPFTINVANPSTAQFLWQVRDGGGQIVDEDFDKMTAKWFLNGPKTVFVTVSNFQCVDTASKDIFILYTPIASFDVKRNVCIDEEVKIYPVKDSGSYHWEVDGNSISETTYRDYHTVSWKSKGTNKIKLFIKNENGCETSSEETILVHDFPENNATNLTPGLCYGKEFKLSTTEGYRYSYDWEPPQYFDFNDRPVVTGIAEKTGYIYVHVTNTWDCTSTDSIYINAESCCEIVMPDAFTPNGDGINDTYKPMNGEQFEITNFLIANRRGQLVFSDITPSAEWDGMHNGKEAGGDTYTYYIKYRCSDGVVKEKKGTLLLLK